MDIEIIKTDNLNKERLDLINKYILSEFGEYIITPIRFQENSRFVFVLESGVIVSFARIFDTKVEFKKSEFDILGLSMVYSIVKGKGFGKELIKSIMNLAESEGKILIGNCEPKNTDFYKKCGLVVLPDVIKRFVYINQRNIAEVNSNDSIVLIYDPRSEFIPEFEKDLYENVFIFEHWW